MAEATPKIGIFVCKCGGNISDVVDVEAVVDAVKNWDGVASAKWDMYLCSKPAQDMIINEIKERGLNRVVIASCTPRMHLATFQNAVERAGLNPYQMEFVSIREHCSWVHGHERSQEATEKAIGLIRGGYEKCFELEPLETISEKCSRNVLVIGAGIAGMMASLELSRIGHKVYLVDRKPTIGGHMAQLTKVFPTLDCSDCILTPRMAEVGRDKNITMLTYSEVQDVEGRPGNYKVKILKKPRYVSEEKCTGCNSCIDICPVKVPNEFDEGRSKRKAVYIPFAQAVPLVATIDESACLKIKHEKPGGKPVCGKCIEACPADAIDFGMKPETVEINVGAIIVATGYEIFDLSQIKEYAYGVYPDVLSMMELERYISISGPTGGELIRSDGAHARRIAIILCAGSRDQHRFIPYCSRICCMYSLKNAVIMQEMMGRDVWIFYTDIRATGKGYEELYWRAQRAGVTFVRGKVGEVWQKRSNGKLVVRAEDTLTGNPIEEEFDLVVLAPPMVPPKGLNELAHKLRIPLGEDGFVQEKHPKLDPNDSMLTGIFVCGCAISPKDVRDSVSDGLGAAARASSFLSGEVVTTSPEKAFVIPELCDGCGACLEPCWYGAITLSDGKAEINPFACVGCGACIPICPKGAIDFKNYTKRQITAKLRGLLRDKKPGETRIIAFVENVVASTGTDFLGLDRRVYPTNVRIIPVPSTAFLSERDILQAFALGADGVIVIEGQLDIDAKITKEKFRKIRPNLRKEYGIPPSRFWYSYIPLPVYPKIADGFNRLGSRIPEEGPFPEEKREIIRQKIGMEA